MKIDLPKEVWFILRTILWDKPVPREQLVQSLVAFEHALQEGVKEQLQSTQPPAGPTD